MELLKKIAVNCSRFLLASVFILSGFVKAIDPLGTQYKIEDYLEAWQLLAYTPHFLTLSLSVALAAIEFCLGIFLFFAIHRRVTTRIILVLMLVLTPLTLWLAIDNPISDCGCFGDAIKLTNWQTFGKNVILLLAAIITARMPLYMVRGISKTNQWIIINYTAVFILFISGLSLYHLPLFDFRPYHIGANIIKGMSIPPGAKEPTFQTTFILQKNGVRKSFDIDHYPDSSWTFIDSKTVQISQGYIPPIHDFSIQRASDGKDITQEILTNKDYVFLLISPHLSQADDSQLDLINQIYEYSEENGYPFICLTASSGREIALWRDRTGAEYEYGMTDETTLKTIIRSNPGLLLLKDATIIRKWSHNNLPDEYTLTAPLNRLEIGKMQQDTIPGKILKIIVWFVLPLMTLTLADRLWAWTKWIQNKKKRISNINILKTKKKMRKKIVAGNWKMNMNLQDGVALAKEINEALVADKPNCDVVICTPFIHLATVAQTLDANVVGLGAENCADQEKGAYTGEVSAEMVKSTGAQYVILGHSERRQYYGETAEILKEKVLLALKNGLKVIFCIGETLEEREAGIQNDVVLKELAGSVYNLSAEEWKNIILAYEPIWAIGTGKTATAEQAEEMLAYIRSTVADKYGKDVAENTSILYGGSCKASNAPELFAKPNIDGGLIGGASLKCADFKGIIDAWKK